LDGFVVLDNVLPLACPPSFRSTVERERSRNKHGRKVRETKKRKRDERKREVSWKTNPRDEEQKAQDGEREKGTTKMKEER